MVRVAVFGSFYRGFYVLDELLRGPAAGRFEVVGVATDDVASGHVSATKRVWRYPHTEVEERLVETLAEAHGVPVYKGRVKADAFYAMFSREWRPDLCVCCTFGQRLDARLHNYPRLGFYNLHPCDEADDWPSRYAGPNPFAALIEDRRAHARIALHRVDDGFDTGALVGYSDRVAIPPGCGVVDLHKITSPIAAKFAVAWFLLLARDAKEAALVG